MEVMIRPGTACGTVTAPPSKSVAHRLLLCAGLAQGESTIENVAYSQDILATLDALQAMGCQVTRQGSRVTLLGADPHCAAPADPVSCRESGSTLRFFIPLFLLSGKPVTLTGQGRLPQRPQSVYEKLCREQGLLFQQKAEFLELQGPLHGGTFTVDGGISSQFISGLLFALPLCKDASCLQLSGTVESRSYINMTLQALERFGVQVSWLDEHQLQIPGGQQYRPQKATVEGDWSNAAFLLALQSLGQPVSVQGLSEESLQGDKICRNYFSCLQHGCPTLDISDCPDLGPILMALGAAQHGVRLTGTARLRLKESDRGQAMAQELAKFGIRCTVEENSIAVSGTLHPPCAVLSSHNDHRVVMSLAILCTRTGGTIAGAEAVSKSYPDFFQQLKQLHIEVREA